MPIPVPQVQQFSIAPMLNAFNQGQQNRVALEDRQRAWDQQAQEAIFRAADLADTPEKWSQFIDTIQGQFPDADLSEFRDFSSRDAALGQAMDPYQRAQLDISQRQLALSEAAANRASTPTPYTDIGKINQDVANGVITREQGDALIAGLTAPQDQTGYRMLSGQEIQDMISQGIALDPTRAYKINLATNEIETVGGQATGLAFDFDPATGAFSLRQGANATGTPTSLNTNQGNAMTFSTRMAQATDLIDNFQNAGTNVWQRFIDAATPEVLGNIGQSSEYQQFRQAETNFITAVLRRESGAAINSGEYADARRVYIPQPGDSPAVLEQKRQARELAIRLMAQNVAPGFDPYAAARQLVTDGNGGGNGGGEAPIGTRVQMPDGTVQVKTENGWEVER